MKTRVVIVVALAFMAPNQSFALTGNDLLQQCTGGELGYCLGYITGVHDGMLAGGIASIRHLAPELKNDEALSQFDKAVSYCLPNGATKLQVRDVVTDFLKANPTSRHNDATLLIWVALSNAFPCQPAIE